MKDDILVVHGMTVNIVNTITIDEPFELHNKYDVNKVIANIILEIDKYLMLNNKIYFIQEPVDYGFIDWYKEVAQDKDLDTKVKLLEDNSIVSNFDEYRDKIKIVESIKDIDYTNVERITLVGLYLDLQIAKNALYLKVVYPDKKIVVNQKTTLTVEKDKDFIANIIRLLDRNFVYTDI